MADINLADIGRAGVGKQVTGFLRDVEGIRGARVAREASEQTIRANEITIRKAQEAETIGNQRLSFNSIRSFTPDMTDNQYDHLIGVAESQGIDLTNDSIKKKDLRGFFDFLQSPTGKNISVQNATIGLNDTRQSLAQIEQGLKTGEINGQKVKPEDLQAQRQGLLARENVLINSLDQLGIEPTVAKEETKTGVNFVLPSGDVVLSLDGGRTTVGGDKIPPGSIKVTGQTPLSETLAQRARTRARAEIETPVAVGEGLGFDAREAALAGTGAFASLAAATDAVLGGFGLDKIFGDEGLFPDIQEARQQLRLLKQTGKSALLNSARGAVWEQEKIDELFPDPDKIVRNPRTEARKLKTIKTVLRQEINFNNRKIAAGATATEIEKFRSSTFELERTLEMLGGDEGGGLSKEDRDLVNQFLPRGQ